MKYLRKVQCKHFYKITIHYIDKTERAFPSFVMDNCSERVFLNSKRQKYIHWPTSVSDDRTAKATCRGFSSSRKWCTCDCCHWTIGPTWVFLVGDGFALCGDRVLEDVHGVLDSLPVQTNLQRVDTGGHVLGQQVAWLGSQPLEEGGHLLLTQTWWRQKGKKRRYK